MSTTPLPLRGPFTPRFILPNETALYGLPDANRQPNILSLVDAASSLIDVHTGRIDGYGNGSLVYSTYMERLLMQAAGRNIVRVNFKPMVAVSASTVNLLSASANYIPNNPQTSKQLAGNPLLMTNYFYTGVQPNTILVTGTPGSTITPIIGCSGRYGYGRRSSWMVWPDLAYGINPLMIASFFGGPPTWSNIDLTLSDFAGDTGEIWVPSGLYAGSFSEIVIVYNAGYDPLNMPRPIKQATAMLVRNFLSRGGGTTGLRSINTAGTANISFSPDLIDTTVDRMLDPFKNVIAY